MEVAISKIRISDRHRKDYGDIESLASSIRELGLLQPVGLTQDYELVFGERRIKAVESLGHTTIEARIVNVPAIVLGEYAENEVRKDFTHSERVAIGEAVEECIGDRQGKRVDLTIKASIQEHFGCIACSYCGSFDDQMFCENYIERVSQSQGYECNDWLCKDYNYWADELPTDEDVDRILDKIEQFDKQKEERKELQQNFAEVKPGTQTLEIAAQRAGFNNKETYRQAKQVVHQGTTELVEAMDTGKVSISAAATIATVEPEEQKEIVARGEKEIIAAAKEINQRKKEERVQKRIEIITAPRPLPEQKYQVIYADPPWQYEFSTSTSREIENQYPTLTLEEIKNLPIHNIADNDSVIFLWATSPKLSDALGVIDAWGFQYVTCAVWDKQKIGMGYYFRQQHELLLVGKRGSLPPPQPENRISSVIQYPREEHSKKPEQFYSIIENMYPMFRRIELFARNTRDNWECWGNQV